MGTDNPFWCPTRYAAGGFGNSTGLPVWLYNFDHLASFDPWPPVQEFCSSHVCKSVIIEMYYVGGSLFLREKI